MIIYIDENLPRQVAVGLDLLQQGLNMSNRTNITVRAIGDVFGRGAKDEDWIPEAGEEKACIITQDININRRKHQRQLCEKYGLGMIYLRPPSKKGLSYWDSVKLIVKHWEEILKVTHKQNRPFSYKISSRSTRLESLD